MDFIYTHVPTIDLSVNAAKDIAIDQFDETDAEMILTLKELKTNYENDDFLYKQAELLVQQLKLEKLYRMAQMVAKWEEDEKRRDNNKKLRQERLEQNRKKVEESDEGFIDAYELEEEIKGLQIQEQAQNFQREMTRKFKENIKQWENQVDEICVIM